MNIIGTTFNDTLNGSNNNDTIQGLAGGDFLYGLAGDDVLQGGDSDDFLTGGLGNDTLDGGFGFDMAQYWDATGGVVVNLASGVASGPGIGTDTLVNIETIDGSAFNDTLLGDGFDNFMNGQGGADLLRGGAGRDFLVGGAGNDTLDGGSDTDTASYSGVAGPVWVNLLTGSGSGADVGSDSLVGIENIYGGKGNDTLTGDAEANFMSGEGGADLLQGGAGNDFLVGGPGNDTLDGGSDYDTAQYHDATGGVVVNLASGTASGAGIGTDTLLSIENIAGSSFNDTLLGDDFGNYMNGDSGADLLQGGAGNDFLVGGPGNDTLDGGSDYDMAQYWDATGGVVVNLASGTASGSGIGTDTLVSIENIAGSSFNDTLLGDDFGNYMDGDSGADLLQGSAGNDFLIGGAGNDTLDGGAGADTLIGGQGNDTLVGGAILDRRTYTDFNFTSYTASPSAVNVNLDTGLAQDGWGGTDVLQDINFIAGSAFNDVLTGSNSLTLFEQFEGLAGNDTINGGTFDALTGRNDNRVTYQNSPSAVNVHLGNGTALDGFGGMDTLINITHVRGSNHADVITGSNAPNHLETLEGRAGNDTINGMGGTDVVRYDSALVGVNVNLQTGVAQDGQGGVDTLLNIEGVRGSNFNDVLTGGNPANGSGALDGFEFFAGNAGNDTINGGSGYDRADYLTARVGVSVILGGAANGTAQDGLGGTDTLINIEAVRGGDFNDVLTGSNTADFESFEGRAGNDTINGAGGTDRADYRYDAAAVNVNLSTGLALDGFGGIDTLFNIEYVGGSVFNDTLTGSSGNDTLEGYQGADVLAGGAGADVFRMSTAQSSSSSVFDTITDFGSTDSLDFRGMSGISLRTSSFGYTGSASATVSAIKGDGGVNNQVVFFTDGSNGYVYIKGAGTGSTNFNDSLVKLNGVTNVLTLAQLIGVTASGGVNPPGTATLGATDDFVVLQPSSTPIVGAGAGNDVYLLSGSMIPAGKAITLSDAMGSNLLQLAPGLSITSSQVSANALKLNLSNNSSLTVLGANTFSYDVGGNLSAGLDPANLSYAQFVQNHLGTTVPTNGLANGIGLSVGSGPSASLLASTAAADDFITLQTASTTIVGGGTGNDTYLLANGLMAAGAQRSISDAQGANSIQLASGLQIASAQVANTALKINLASGASITILGANQFTYESGGNTTAGVNGADLSYAQFVQTILGTSVPASGTITTSAVTIGNSSIAVTGNQTLVATAAAEVFRFDVTSALADVSGNNTQASISGFALATDTLRIDLPTADSALTTLSQLNGVQGVLVQFDPFDGATIINFGNDVNGAQPVTLTLQGITDPGLVQIQVV